MWTKFSQYGFDEGEENVLATRNKWLLIIQQKMYYSNNFKRFSTTHEVYKPAYDSWSLSKILVEHDSCSAKTSKPFWSFAFWSFSILVFFKLDPSVFSGFLGGHWVFPVSLNFGLFQHKKLACFSDFEFWSFSHFGLFEFDLSVFSGVLGGLSQST